jgi:TfoX/Sxy family transcriptional regulator of competence genes
MAYDEDLARRVRARLAGRPGVSEKRTFGGLGFLQDGNLAVGVQGADLLVRVGAAAADAALARPGVSQFVNSGRSMRGWVVVEAAVLVDDVALHDWVDEGHGFAAGLPPK